MTLKTACASALPFSPKYLFLSLRVRRTIRRMAKERQKIDRQMRLELLGDVRKYR